MDQPRLFRLAVDALAVSAFIEPGQGWHCHIAVRRGDESWSDAYSETYSHLTTPELVDLIEGELNHQLGL